MTTPGEGYPPREDQPTPAPWDTWHWSPAPGQAAVPDSRYAMPADSGSAPLTAGPQPLEADPLETGSLEADPMEAGAVAPSLGAAAAAPSAAAALGSPPVSPPVSFPGSTSGSAPVSSPGSAPISWLGGPVATGPAPEGAGRPAGSTAPVARPAGSAHAGGDAVTAPIPTTYPPATAHLPQAAPTTQATLPSPGGHAAYPPAVGGPTPWAGGSPAGWSTPPPAGPAGATAYAPGRGRGPGWASVLGIAGVTGLIAALAGAGLGASLAGDGLFDRGTGTSVERPAGSFAALAAAALPSVVTIRATGSGSGATGSGFVYDTAGHVITNNHVVEGVGEEITVVLNDGSTVEAEIVGTDPAYDIAVLDTKRTDLKPLPMADSKAVVVGDEVLAMGAPLGLESTVTSGIVSAVDRPVVAGDSTSRSYINAIQTDAAINPGNSGGPLIDTTGKVIGVNSAIATPPGSSSGNAGNIGLGFAIPSAQVVKTADQLIRTGSSEHPIIGVLLDESYSGPGAKVKADNGGDDPITAGGPADKAGIQPGDVIVRFDGHEVSGPDDLIVAIRAKSVGDTVAMTVRRDGQPVDVTMTLQAAPKK